jgi:hypothetical protein
MMSEPTDTDLDGMTREELIAEVKRLRKIAVIEPDKPIEYVKIIIVSIFAACVYGIAHDLVTAHICIAYFLPPTHPVIVPTDSPIILALIWGIVATWWVGLFLGVFLAFVCRIGQKPKLTIKNIMLPVFCLLVLLYVISMLLGAIGYVVALGILPLFSMENIHASFIFNLVAHNSAYLLGTIGGVMLMFRLWKKRRLLADNISTRPQPAG